MVTIKKRHEELLTKLDETVVLAAACFSKMDRNLSDGKNTAFAVLAQLVFWHKEYINVARSLVAGKELELPIGSFANLNARARIQYFNASMLSLSRELSELQKEFHNLLMQIPDWTVNFPIKFDSPDYSLEERLVEIEKHIAMHLRRFQSCKEMAS